MSEPTPVDIADSIMGYLDGNYDEAIDCWLSVSTMGNSVFVTATDPVTETSKEFLVSVRPHNHDTTS